MKILFSAYSCGATKTSEPGNAWRAVNHAIADGHEVWAVIQKSGYERDFNRYLADHPLPGFHPVFFDLAPPVERALCKPGLPGNIYYRLWQGKLLGIARELHARVRFDLVQHITFGRYWSPCGVRELGIPFIWGPVGAAESAPASFLAELPPQERLFEFVRDSVRAVSHFDPALRNTAAAADIAIGISRESCDALRSLGARRIEQLPQAALADDELAEFDRFPPPPPGPLRAICMGRLLHWKGFHLAIRAFALFARNSPKAELWILNDGPFRCELEKTAADSGIGPQVRFFGHLSSYSDVLDKLAQSHVLLHPALHEAFGNACMEALAAGRPVACLDIGGPAAQVTPECGFAAPITSPQAAVEALASFLTRIDGDRALLAAMSGKARDRVREKFTMRIMGAAFSSFYRQVTEARMHRDEDKRALTS